MIRDRRTRSPRACRPRQAARLVRGVWTVDDRWVGVAAVPRSAAAESMMDFAPEAAPVPERTDRPPVETD
ncbi:hypothetical protein ACIHDR_16480 [Nocardia sp. NPDC052278]|uniref:hypothetical protein n=1 Tax=Nocardia sp. NPDC052278 TaxID=3364328 RepID=UPI0037C7F4D0